MNHAFRDHFTRGDASANLLPNPGFEHAAPGDPLRPAGWVIDCPHPSSIMRSPHSPRSGRWALDASLHFTKEGEGAAQLITEHPIRIKPGARFAIGGSFLHVGAPGNPEHARASIWIAGRWICTADGDRVVGSFFEFPCIGLPEGVYDTRQAIVRAPRDADALIAVFIFAGGDPQTNHPASLTVDDLFLRVVSDQADRAHAERHTPHLRRQHNDPHAGPRAHTTGPTRRTGPCGQGETNADAYPNLT